MNQTFDALWGAILDDVSLDLVAQTVTIVVRVSHKDVETTFQVVARGVHELHFTNAIPGPWAYTELTEIHAEALENGQMKIKAMLWSEEASLVVVADAFTVNGTEFVASSGGPEEQ